MGFDTLLFVFKLISHGCFLKLWYILYIVDVFSIFYVYTHVNFVSFLGYVLCMFVGFMVCTMFLCNLYALFYSVLLTKCHAFSF